MDMHKNIGTSAIGRDKAESAIRVEEFHLSTWHSYFACPGPMPLLGARLILEDQAEQEMHVAAVGSAFRRLGR
jgi:hypothetical protein